MNLIGETPQSLAANTSQQDFAAPQPSAGRVVAQVVAGNAGRRQLPLGPKAPSPWPSILVLWAIAAVIWMAILLHL